MSAEHFDLTGINNRNEYFTNHYFASSFYDDDAVKALLSRWQEERQKSQRAKTPWSLLGDAGRRYYVAHDRYEKTRFTRTHLSLIQQMADVYLDALGYDGEGVVKEQDIPVSAELTAPVYAEVKDAGGAPLLWIILTAFPDEADQDIISACPIFTKKLRMDDTDIVKTDVLPNVSNEELVNQAFFGNRVEHPRFIMLIGIDQIVLLDRNKWGDKKYFSFDLSAIFGRHEPTTLRAMAALLHKEALCPKEDKPLLDALDAASYRNANAVSDDLKYALRESIELLGNEVLYYYRTHHVPGVEAEEIDAADLSIQCVRYMYRLLFLFFMESRPELGYAPIKENTYLSAYSIESLRSIAEQVRPDDMVGENYYFSDTLSTLFNMIYNGYPRKDEDLKKCEAQESAHDVFVILPLKAHIFDRERTPLLYHARMRDEVMIRIINLMSLTRDRGNKKQRRGRISYANLGINQIGSVYEALLSYRGFIAREKLYEVKKAGDKFNELDVGYFVPEDEVKDYAEDERVRYETGPKKGQLRTYEKGTFIYRLAGREREQSASYYTPESLTKCLVKYALKELLKNKTADEILHLKVCEPAMGSAAFLNEAINQLAEAYINKKQEELGDTIPYDRRARELQKVKMYIADENVYGIDLNPTAVELAEVSLWLNTIYSGGYVPWFRTQLVNGNSLIGARRECYDKEQLTATAKGLHWYDAEPKRIMPGKQRNKKNQIYHFLLGDPGMSKYDDKVIRKLEPDHVAAIKKWNKEFTKPYTGEEVNELMELSQTIDTLFKDQVELRHVINDTTQDVLSIYPETDKKVETRTTIREKDRIYDKYYKSQHEKNAGAYARLKFAMDYWCALWFWPIDKADQLPNRTEFINDMYLILRGTIDTKGDSDLLDEEYFPSLFGGAYESKTLQDKLDEVMPQGQGRVNLDQLCLLFPRLQTAKEIAEKNHFFHWELEFADVFADNGGFDLILGNPPWIKIQWQEEGVLSDYNPLFAVKKFSASETAKQRNVSLEDEQCRDAYVEEYIENTGLQNYLNSTENYYLLKGQQTNLYKCFLPQSWKYIDEKGCASFLHPDGVYDDPAAGLLRSDLFSRLRYHFQFINEKMLFREIDHHNIFGINVYGEQLPKSKIHFDSISNLVAPETVDECYANQGEGNAEGLKNDNGSWSIKGHKDRIVKYSYKQLKIMSSLFDFKNPMETKLLGFQTNNLFETTRCFGLSLRKLRNLKDEICLSEMLHETNAQKNGLMNFDVHFPKTIDRMIYCGPHISVANPFGKTPKRISTKNLDYDSIDLTEMNFDYIPRSKYSLTAKFHSQYDMQNLFNGNPYRSYPKLASRKMLNLKQERTLNIALLPENTSHINGLVSMVFQNEEDLLMAACSWISLPVDFYTKIMGKVNFNFAAAESFPVFKPSKRTGEMITRGLLLQCLTSAYQSIYQKGLPLMERHCRWTKKDARLDNHRFDLPDTLTWEVPLRTDYERRQALVEIDVLVAMELGMTLEQLKEIYRIQFPVLQSYEKDTWYDANGRIVFTTNRSLTNVGFSRKEWEDGIKGAPAGKKFYRTITDDTMPGGPVERTIEYVAPFDRCDREKDYETAWKFFEEKYGK